jgi:hypothetical protein
MEKNWLIRTKSNHILGPVSKEKVLELLRNGSIKPDDEVCSGNGYWFFIREDELVSRFLLGDEVQGFNPISEAKDVLHSVESPSQRDEDITLIGSINTSMLKEVEVPEAGSTKTDRRDEPLPTKKKVKKLTTPHGASTEKVIPRRQNYLQYLAFLCFIILFLLVYYRKTIIRALFQGEVTISSFIMSSAHAQTSEGSAKKKITERSLRFDKIEFRPSIGLSGFRVSSTFDISDINCSDLSSSVTQLGIILYPSDTFHEKFLLKMRECGQTLKDDHPVKRWLNWVGKPQKSSASEQELMQFLSEIMNSRFNLITEVSVKKRIIEVIKEIPGNDIGEKLLKSYLFLMVGNISHSDQILRDIARSSPFESWKGYRASPSVFSRVTRDNIEQLLLKLSKHPSDRKSYALLERYLTEFFNEPILLDNLKDQSSSALKGLWNLRYTLKLSPNFVRYLRLGQMDSAKRIRKVKSGKLATDFLTDWVWYFYPEPEIFDESSIKIFKEVEKKNPLWAIYLLEVDRLSDLYLHKAGKNHINETRKSLHSYLVKSDLFMLSLYQLIERGDFSSETVEKTLQFLIHE